jgi:CRP-like cAMP-binding protein
MVHGDSGVEMTTHTAEVQALSSLYLFKQTPIEAIAELVQASRVLSFPAGDRIFRVGDPSDTALLVITGRLIVVLPEGEREYRLGDVRPGEITGETALLTSDGRRGASLCVQEDATCLELTPELLMVMPENPAVVALEVHLMGTMGRRIREINTNIKKATRSQSGSDESGESGGAGLLGRLRAFFRGE